MPFNKVTQGLQKQQIDKICENFIQSGNAFYHPVTKKLSYIINGHCIKGECNNRKIDKVNEGENKGFGDRKILLPEHIQPDFMTTKAGLCALDKSKIGQVVICLNHFFIEHQKFYLENGFVPPEARLIRNGEQNHVEGMPIADPEPFEWREEEKLGDKSWRGYKIAVTLGLSNYDWVNLI